MSNRLLQGREPIAAVSTIIVAGGSGSRFGHDVPKQYQTLAGEAMLRRTVQLFCDHPRVSTVCVVIRAGDEALYAAATAGLDIWPPVTGDDTRQGSVLRGLESLEQAAPSLVLIHDAARPLCPANVIDRVLDALATVPAAIPALPVQDTIKRASRHEPDLIAETVPRTDLWRAQTPQGFRFPDILDAHRRFAGWELTDDAAVAEAAGLQVALVPGAEDNIKVTTPDDLERAERALSEATPIVSAPDLEVRTGIGIDVHRFGPGDHVMLAGIRVPHDAGLIGHSDADVALHALTDALLGAIAAGDIGQHFSPHDPRWKDAASAQFLVYAAELVRAAGGRIINADISIICERPKVGPHRDRMVERLADILHVTSDRISVKATTTERLGFTGRREGIAAEAVATVQLQRGGSHDPARLPDLAGDRLRSHGQLLPDRGSGAEPDQSAVPPSTHPRQAR